MPSLSPLAAQCIPAVLQAGWLLLGALSGCSILCGAKTPLVLHWSLAVAHRCSAHLPRGVSAELTGTQNSPFTLTKHPEHPPKGTGLTPENTQWQHRAERDGACLPLEPAELQEHLDNAQGQAGIAGLSCAGIRSCGTLPAQPVPLFSCSIIQLFYSSIILLCYYYISL